MGPGGPTIEGPICPFLKVRSFMILLKSGWLWNFIEFIDVMTCGIQVKLVAPTNKLIRPSQHVFLNKT